MRLRTPRLALCCALLTIPLVAPACSDENVSFGGDDGGGGDDGPAVTDDAYEPGCGNGMKDPGEQCDNGTAKNLPGSGCEPGCQFTCTVDTKCDDSDPCNGAETCTAEHTCKAGTSLADGAGCGAQMICKGAVCVAAACGDGITTAPEECDDSNQMGGDGCEPSCKFTCVSTDNTRDCTPADACAGKGTCDDVTHKCGAGTPLVDGTGCGQGRICKGGVCSQNPCGNGMVDQGEQCDDSNQVNGDGCDADCKFSCGNPAADCPARGMASAPPACELWTCTNAHVCLAAPDAGKDGQTCGVNLVCKSGACVAPNAMCGNGVKEPGEDCDFGAGNGAGTGCEKTCKFSCVKQPDSCPDANVCNGAETCVNVTVNAQTGQKCMAAMSLANGAACGNGSICLAGVCKLSACGDGFVDKGRGEDCEPPNTMACDAACKFKPVCGNGRRENGEQCDDANLVNLDGCNGTCQFEQDHRMNWLKMQFATDAYCTANALGGAIVNGTAQGQLQTSLDDGIADGSTSVLIAMLGITDLTGTNNGAFNLGLANGTPQGLPNMAYSGAADLDWWYATSALSIDMTRTPTAKLPATIANKVLNAGPGAVTLTLLLSGAATPLKMSNVKLTVTTGASSKPKVSINAMPPGHLPAENLDPNLVSCDATGQPNTNGAGKMCGNITASSLAKVPLPASVVQTCTAYTVNNSMLDLVVGGCSLLGGLITIVRPTQPDRDDPGVAPVGGGPNYRLSATANRKIDTCRDKNNAVVNFAMCLDDAAYSSFFKFTTDRVIMK